MTETKQPLTAYYVTQREYGQTKTVLANSADEACQMLGYLIDDCHVEEARRYDRYLRGEGSQIMVKLSIRACPFQDSLCQLSDELECPNRPDAPDLTGWVKQASKSHLCEHVGNEITRKEWLGRFKWTKLADIPPASNRH